MQRGMSFVPERELMNLFEQLLNRLNLTVEERCTRDRFSGLTDVTYHVVEKQVRPLNQGIEL